MPFGLQPLLNRRLAIISDARLSGRSDQAVITERLLSISGEDGLTVHRKHLTSWTGRLPTRFLILTNELPRLSDMSGAMSSRFILLCLKQSWLGREDSGLTDALLRELPAILNWAMVGFKELRLRGRFAVPKSSAEAMQELEDLASPMTAFIRDKCSVGAGQTVPVEELFDVWRHYCEETGREHPGTRQTFGRDLRAVLPTLRTIMPRYGDSRMRSYAGIGLAE